MHSNETYFSLNASFNTNSSGPDGPWGKPNFQPPTSLDITRQLSWGFLVVFVLAVFGNTVIAIVMNKPRNRELASSTFFTALAISDLIHATQVSLEKWLRGIAGVTLFTTSGHRTFAGLKIAINFGNLQTSTFILVGITIERLLCITLPHKVKHLCTPFTARLWVLLIVVSSFGMHLLSFFFLYGVDPFPIFHIVPKVRYGDQIFHVIDMVCGFIIPFLILSIGSVIIIIHLYRRAGNDAALSRAHAATRNLIMANMAFMVTISPFRIMNILMYLDAVEINPINEVILKVLMVIVDSNSAINFFVYCLGSPRFRQDIKQQFGIRGKTQNSSSITKSTPVQSMQSKSQ